MLAANKCVVKLFVYVCGLRALKYFIRNNAHCVSFMSFLFKVRQTNHLLNKAILSVSIAMLAESLSYCGRLFTLKLTKERISTQTHNHFQFTYPLLGILQIHHLPPTAPNPLFVSSLTCCANDSAIQHCFSCTLDVITECDVRMRIVRAYMWLFDMRKGFTAFIIWASKAVWRVYLRRVCIMNIAE